VGDAALDPDLIVVVCHGTFSRRVSPRQLVRALISLFLMKRSPIMNGICAYTCSKGRTRQLEYLDGDRNRVFIKIIARYGLDSETVLLAN
jgi:hypothetical protein